MSPTSTVSGGQFLTTGIGPEDIFTREDLTDEQRLFGQAAGEFMRGEVVPREARLYAHDWDLTRDLLRKAGELDLLRLEIPEAYGGLGLDKISSAFVAESIAVNPSFGGSLGAHTAIGTLPLVYFGTDEQKARYLPRLASGELIAAYALTEPQSGSDALAAKTTARMTDEGRHYVLNGQKMWITNGGFADLFTVFAKVDGEKFTAFLVERGMGVVSGSDEKKLGLDGSSTTALMLDNVKVPVENVLGKIGEGHKVAFNILNFGRVKLGARNMACAKIALTNAVVYAKDRRQFGRAICEFGLIKRKIAEMAVRCYVGDAMTYRALGDVDRALEAVNPNDSALVLKTIEGFAVECSINKVYTSEALAYVVDEALQVFGGNGYSREFPAERAYRDARITRIYEGTNEINRLIIPTRLLKQGSGALHDERSRTSHDERSRTSHDARNRTSHDARSTSNVLAPERGLLDAAKSLALALLREAADAYGEAVKEEQEVLADIADVIVDVYAVESAIARTEKICAARGLERAGAALDATRVFAADAAERQARLARQVRRALAARNRGASVAGLCAPLASFEGIDGIAARRRIADAIIAAGKYSL
jgi:alkylation response protein AidB-like acyl-CoA dehydrogenase